MKDSPIKKLDFHPEDKENMPEAVEPTVSSDLTATKPTVEAKAAPASTPVAKTIKELEAEEPLLKENPHRFVLFPLQYHGSYPLQPDHASFKGITYPNATQRSGTCTSAQKLPSGRLKKSICPRIFMTGTTV
jgi:hypothetical protein